jgi:hypothetical protein
MTRSRGAFVSASMLSLSFRLFFPLLLSLFVSRHLSLFFLLMLGIPTALRAVPGWLEVGLRHTYPTVSTNDES